MAVPPLRALVEAGHDVAVVVTRPDRPRGRGPATSPSPVKEEARRLGIPVVHGLDPIVDSGVSLGVVVAYGRIVPSRVLDRVPMVNLHFSLLPRWRGAAPVERAILAGDEVTGVSVMALEAGLDTGPIYATEEVAIAPGEGLASLRGRLVEVGSRRLVDLLAGPFPEPRPQEGEPTYAEKITAQDLHLDWSRPAIELQRVVRLGRAWTSWRGRRLRILATALVAPPDGAAAHDPSPPGSLDGVTAATGAGALRLLRVQPEGKESMDAAAWRHGARPGPGERLGDP